MECPHCESEYAATPHFFALGEDRDGSWQISNVRCPSCDRLIISLCNKEGSTYPVWPQSSTRPRLSADVPPEYANEYLAACQVLVHSPEASAALSRRLLHTLLAAEAGAGHGPLTDQIRQAIVSSGLPPYLKQALQTLSRVAHLQTDSPKSLRPEALSPVEPGEAEWLLDVLQPMLDLFFVQPARMQRKQDRLEEKIAPPAPPESTGSPVEDASSPDAGDAPSTPVGG